MLIPSIDLMGGRIVQLVRGEKLQVAFDDFDYWLERFAPYRMVQLIDLDAAMRTGSNAALIEQFAKRLHCQVGGGVHTVQRAQELLDAGAERVIFGSRLFQNGRADAEFAAEVRERLGRERFVAGVDTKAGTVAVRGWKESAGLTPELAIPQLEAYCSAFLYTHVDTEGTMTGFPLGVARRLRELTVNELIVAGGIREQAEIDVLDAMGVDAVSGMAIYTGALQA